MIDAIWSRDGIIIADNTPHHILLVTEHEQREVVASLFVDSTTVNDDDNF